MNIFFVYIMCALMFNVCIALSIMMNIDPLYFFNTAKQCQAFGLG